MANEQLHVQEAADLHLEIDRLRRVCAEAYQLAGAVGAPVRVLDILAAAAEGRPLPCESFLPVAAEECDEVADLQRRLDQVRSAVGWTVAANR